MEQRPLRWCDQLKKTWADLKKENDELERRIKKGQPSTQDNDEAIEELGS